MSQVKKQIRIILERSSKGMTLDAYCSNIKKQICSCILPILGKEDFIKNEIILFFKSLGFFLDKKTGKFSKEGDESE